MGTYVFPYIAAAGQTDTQSAQYPFYVSSCLCLLSAALAFLLPHIGQDTITLEDRRFRAYLESKGWDTRQLGLGKSSSESDVEVIGAAAAASLDKGDKETAPAAVEHDRAPQVDPLGGMAKYHAG